MLKPERVRRGRDMSQAELAKRTGLSRSYISELENGKYKPTIKVICKLCKALECSPNDLIICE